jgi:type VI secretion system protein VasI
MRNGALWGVRLFGVGLVLLGTTGPSAASDELRRCRNIESGLERLACYDALVPTPNSTAAERPSGSWRSSTDVSRFDDSKSVHLATTAREPVSGWPGKVHTPTLHVRCQERKTSVYIVFGMSPAVEYGHMGATVQIRTDKDPVRSIRTSKSTDGEALFLPDAVATVKALFGKQELLVRFTPFNSNPQETSFSVAGLEGAIAPLRETCGW